MGFAVSSYLLTVCAKVFLWSHLFGEIEVACNVEQPSWTKLNTLDLSYVVDSDAILWNNSDTGLILNSIVVNNTEEGW